MIETETLTVRRGVPVDPVHWAEVMGNSAGYLGWPATRCGLRDAAETASWVRGYLAGWRDAKRRGALPPPPAATRTGAHWLLVEDQVIEQGVRHDVPRADLAAMLERPIGAIKVEASRRGLISRRTGKATLA